MTPVIVSGENINVTLKVTNHKEYVATGVIVNDKIPAGTSYVNGSATGYTPSLDGNLITFDIGDMLPGGSITINYQLTTPTTEYSESQFFDGMENGDNLWDFNNLSGNAIWDISDDDPKSGIFSWFVPDTEERNDQTLYFFDPFLVHGEQPVLRFAHKYNTEPGTDGGFVDISIDGGDSWEDVSDLFFRKEYRGEIAFLTFSKADQKAFWGDSNGYVDSYVDLSPFSGEYILVRFRFGSDTEEEGDMEEGIGWFVDDIEIMDMHNYHTQACVSSQEGDFVCAYAPGKGTVVNAGDPSSVIDRAATSNFEVFPNPAEEVISCSFTMDRADQFTINIFSMDGRKLKQYAGFCHPGYNQLPMDVSTLSSGIYFCVAQIGNNWFSKKIIIE